MVRRRRHDNADSQVAAVIRAIALRVLAAVPVMLGVAIVSFFLIRLVPGDVVDSIMGTEYSDPEIERALRQYYGVDDPVWRDRKSVV